MGKLTRTKSDLILCREAMSFLSSAESSQLDLRAKPFLLLNFSAILKGLTKRVKIVCLETYAIFKFSLINVLVERGDDN